jgi:dipeptidyl-peptidase 4
VHVSQTLRLVDVLLEHDRDFELLIIPNAGHDVLMSSGSAQRRVWDYMVRNLLGAAPPQDFQIRFTPEELRRYASNAARELRE